MFHSGYQVPNLLPREFPKISLVLVFFFHTINSLLGWISTWQRWNFSQVGYARKSSYGKCAWKHPLVSLYHNNFVYHWQLELCMCLLQSGKTRFLIKISLGKAFDSLNGPSLLISKLLYFIVETRTLILNLKMNTYLLLVPQACSHTLSNYMVVPFYISDMSNMILFVTEEFYFLSHLMCCSMSRSLLWVWITSIKGWPWF